MLAVSIALDDRMHRSFDKDAPLSRPVQPTRSIELQVLGTHSSAGGRGARCRPDWIVERGEQKSDHGGIDTAKTKPTRHNASQQIHSVVYKR